MAVPSASIDLSDVRHARKFSLGLAEPPFFGDSRWSFYTIFPVMRRHARHMYAHLEELAQELHDSAFDLLGDYYPYVHDIDPHFAEAEARGYFLEDDRGRTRTFTVFMDRVAQVDLTNPDARAWYAKELEHGVARSEATS